MFRVRAPHEHRVEQLPVVAELLHEAGWVDGSPTLVLLAEMFEKAHPFV
jgi:hypothetical protein